MFKQLTNAWVIVSFDDTSAGTNHQFITDVLEQAQVKAQRLLALTKSGNVVIKTAASGEVIDYFEK